MGTGNWEEGLHGKWEQGSGKKDYMGSGNREQGRRITWESGNKEVGRWITWEVGTGNWEDGLLTWEVGRGKWEEGLHARKPLALRFDPSGGTWAGNKRPERTTEQQGRLGKTLFTRSFPNIWPTHVFADFENVGSSSKHWFLFFGDFKTGGGFNKRSGLIDDFAVLVNLPNMCEFAVLVNYHCAFCFWFGCGWG